MSSLAAFLHRNNIPISREIPIVHSTPAYYLKKIMMEKKITPRKCDVFVNDDLSYFFVGRPSYKQNLNSEAEYWQLPSCIVMNYDSVTPKRVYPFDSGAFSNKILPEFITMMPIGEFETSAIQDSYKRIVGAFFNTPDDYYKLIPRRQESFESEFEADILDEEVKALYKLILTKSGKADDRRFAIEVQTEQNVHLNASSVLAVIFPEQYCDSDKFLQLIEDIGADGIPYPTFPLKQEYYYYAIYEKLFEYYKRKGIMR